MYRFSILFFVFESGSGIIDFNGPMVNVKTFPKKYPVGVINPKFGQNSFL